MEKEKINDIIFFLKLKKQLEEIDAEIDYINTLLHEARKELNVMQLEEISKYMNVLTNRLDQLQNQRNSIMNQLDKISPKYYKIINLTSKIVSYFITNRDRVLNSELSIEEFRDKMRDLYPKINEVISILTSEMNQLNELIDNYANHPFANVLRKEIDKIKENLAITIRIKKTLDLDVNAIKKLAKYLGLWVKNQDTNETGLITNMVLRKEDFIPFLEISKEEEVESSILEELFNEISIELGVNNLEELIYNINKDLGVNIPITPSLLIRYIRKNNLSISVSLIRKLVPKYKKLGYVSINRLVSAQDVNKMAILNIRSDDLNRDLNAFRAPSLIMLSSDLLFRSINILGYKYTLFRQAILPKLGYSVILLLRNEKNDPLPNYLFLKRFLEIIKRVRLKLFQDLGIMFDANKISPEDITWISRLVIVKALSREKNITESNALRPNNLFSFCLKFGIPIFYEEILQSYFNIMETSNFSFGGGRLKLKVEKLPYPISKYINLRYLAPYLPHNCMDLLGVTIKRDSMKLHCFTYLEDETIQSLISDFKIPSKLAITIENDPKRLLRAIILSRRIRTIEEYSKVKKKLNIMTIDYEDIEKKIGKSSRDILQRTLLENF